MAARHAAQQQEAHGKKTRKRQEQPLAPEAIEQELKRLRAASKARAKQLKQLKEAGKLLGDVLARGFLSAYLLRLCAERPRHGNDLIREIEERTDGLWSPSSGGVYTVLKKLEKRGWLEGAWEEGETRERRVYRMTDAGHEALNEFLEFAPTRVASALRVLELVSADLLKPLRAQ